MYNYIRYIDICLSYIYSLFKIFTGTFIDIYILCIYPCGRVYVSEKKLLRFNLT